MQNVVVAKPGIRTDALNVAVRSALGVQTTGVSVGSYGMIAHLVDGATSGDIALAEAVLNGHNTLVVGTDKATITADDSDTATITCSDAGLGADAAIDYTVWLDGELFAQGSDNVVGGTVSLTLKSAVAGTFVIEIRRQSGNYASGYVTVEAE